MTEDKLSEKELRLKELEGHYLIKKGKELEKGLPLNMKSASRLAGEWMVEMVAKTRERYAKIAQEHS